MNTTLLNNGWTRLIRPRLGDVRRWLRSRPERTRGQKLRLLQSGRLSERQAKLLARVESRISPNDGMYKGDGAHYFMVGLSAVSQIEQAIVAADIQNVRNCLDLPCGHGRVLRFLVHLFPQTQFSACDLNRRGVDFCARMFGAKPIYSQVELDEFNLNEKFDLIWVGSLITHLSADRIKSLLKFLARHLAPHGLLVFTTAGQEVFERMEAASFDYGMRPADIKQITEDYRQSGFGYADYPYAVDYGISLSSTAWVRAQVNELDELEEKYFAERGWDNHQDVFGFVRRSSSDQ